LPDQVAQLSHPSRTGAYPSLPSTCRRAWPVTLAQHPARRYARHEPSPSVSSSHATSCSRRWRTAAR
jgi:hypothetical protein